MLRQSSLRCGTARGTRPAPESDSQPPELTLPRHEVDAVLRNANPKLLALAGKARLIGPQLVHAPEHVLVKVLHLVLIAIENFPLVAASVHETQKSRALEARKSGYSIWPA